MTKRVYWETVKKWAIKAGIPAGVAGFALLFIYLSSLGVIEVTGYSGDMVCAGTESDPCYAFINFSTTEDIFIYPLGYDPWGRDTPFNTDKGLKSWKMYRSWGKGWREIKLNQTCTATWCGAPPNSPDNKYAFAFREGRDYQIKYEVIKNNSEEIIKWGFGPVDPTFFGYNSTTRTAFLTDATIKLESSQKVNIIRGEDRMVGEFTIGNQESRLLEKEIEFYDINNEMIQIERDFTYKYEKSVGFETISDYIQVCEDKTYVNGTKYKECYKELTGTHKEEKFRWVEFDTSKKLPKGEITIGIFTDVLPNDEVEWIPTLFGVRIDEWAGWQDSFDVDLAVYYDFEDTGDGYLNDSLTSNSTRDGVLINTPTITTGIVGSGLSFDGSQYVNLSYNLNDIGCYDKNIGCSISVWVKVNTSASGHILGDYSGGVGLAMSQSLITTAVLIYPGNYRITLENAFPVNDEWYHVAFVMGEEVFSIYINGSKKEEVATENIGNSLASFKIAGRGDLELLTGDLDEVGIWTRNLSATEVSQLYNNGSGVTYPPADIGPTVTLNSPVNAYNTTIPEIIFNCTASDDFGITNVSLLINNTIEQTNTSGINGTEYSFTHTLATGVGHYNWSCIAYDSINQSTTASVRTFTYVNDLAVSLTSPVAGYNSTSKTITFNGTASDDTAIINVSLYIDGVLNQTNSSGLNATDYLFTKSLSDGSHNWTYQACDAFSCLNATTRLLTVNTTPDIQFVSPTYADFTTSPSSYVPVNVTVTETSFSNLTFNFYNGTITSYFFDNSTRFINVSLADDSYEYNVTVWTTTRQKNTTVTRNITVDTTFPSVYYNPNADTSGFVDRDWILVNITAIDITLHSVRLNWNGTNETFATSDGDSYWENKTGLSDGNYTFYGWANDSVGKYNLTAIREINIDTENPLIEFTTGTADNNSLFDRDWIFVNVSVTEANFKNITFGLYNSTGEVNLTTYITEIYQINWTSLPGEFYYYNVTARDLSGNTNTTETRKITLAHLTLFFNGIEGNLTAELGSVINITANATANVNICFDIDYVGYGTNYSCSFGSNSFNFTPTYFRKTTFANGSTNQTYNYSSAQEEFFNVSINVHIYDEVDNLTINLSQGSGNPKDVTFYIINTTPTFTGTVLDENSTQFIDRAFHGLIVGSNLYLNEFSDSNLTKNITFPVASEKTVYFVLDDDIVNKVYTFFFNITGFLFGFDYADGSASTPIGFSNYNNLDTDLTTAHLDSSGMIMAKNVSESLYIYDDFEDGVLNQTLIANTSCYEVGNDKSCVSESSGVMILEIDLIDASSNAEAQTLLLDKAESDVINFSITANYVGYDHSSSTISTTTYIKFGGTTLWSLISQNQINPATGESSDAAIDFYLYKLNQTHWGYRMYGTENATAGGRSPIYIVYSGVENIISVSSSQIYIYNYVSAAGDRGINDLKVKYINRTLWTRENGTAISKSIYDAGGDITHAQLWVWTKNAEVTPEESLYAFLSADNGETWENTWGNGTLHTFSTPGRHLKWRLDFNITGTDNNYLTTQVAKVNITIPSGYPENVTFDFGDDNSTEYTFEGQLNGTNSPVTINLSYTNLSLAFNSGTKIWNHTYRIPLVISSASIGLVKMDTLNLTYNPNPISLNASRIQSYLGNLSNETFINFTIPVSYNNNTEIDAAILIDDLRYDYAGGNKTILVSARDITDVLNTTKQILYYYSRWDYFFVPQFVSWLEFIPSIPTSKNVTPFGQTLDTPILNLTNYGYGGIEANLSIYLNETLGCVNLTMSLTENKTDGVIINSSWQNLTGMSYLETVNISMWADFGCNYTNWNLFNPYLYFRQCALGAYCSEDLK